MTDGGTNLHQAMGFSLNNDFFELPTNLVMAEEFFTFPGYSEDLNPGTGDDIALIRLSDPILDVTAAERYRGPELVDPIFNAAGFGAPGVWPNEGNFDGILRAGRNIADDSSPLVDMSKFWVFDMDEESDAIALEWIGSQYDSGGGWFTDVNGQMQLIGISNFVRGQNTLGGGIRISQYNEWIDSRVNPVPEPSSLVLWATATLSGLALRRRKRCSA